MGFVHPGTIPGRPMSLERPTLEWEGACWWLCLLPLGTLLRVGWGPLVITWPARPHRMTTRGSAGRSWWTRLPSSLLVGVLFGASVLCTPRGWGCLLRIPSLGVWVRASTVLAFAWVCLPRRAAPVLTGTHGPGSSVRSSGRRGGR